MFARQSSVVCSSVDYKRIYRSQTVKKHTKKQTSAKLRGGGDRGRAYLPVVCSNSLDNENARVAKTGTKRVQPDGRYHHAVFYTSRSDKTRENAFFFFFFTVARNASNHLKETLKLT